MLIVVDRPWNLLTIVFFRKGIPGLVFFCFDSCVLCCRQGQCRLPND